jgi:hypothetical protein
MHPRILIPVYPHQYALSCSTCCGRLTSIICPKEYTLGGYECWTLIRPVAHASSHHKAPVTRRHKAWKIESSEHQMGSNKPWWCISNMVRQFYSSVLFIHHSLQLFSQSSHDQLKPYVQLHCYTLQHPNSIPPASPFTSLRCISEKVRKDYAPKQISWIMEPWMLIPYMPYSHRWCAWCPCCIG